MDIQPRKQLLLLITNTHAATNIIHSGIMKHLAKQYDLHIASDIISDQELSVISHHYHIHVRPAHLRIPSENWIIRFLRQFEKALFFDYFGIETQKIKDQQLSYWRRNIVAGILNTLSILNLTRDVLQILRKTIISLTSQYRLPFKDNHLKFDGVVSTSPLDIRENTIVNSLHNIRSLAIIISWDNLTSKGIINTDYDSVLVWNQYMADEYQRFYSIFGLPEQKVQITGIPRFDIYFEPLPSQFSPTNLRHALHISDASQVILFATSAIKHFPNQADILSHLIEYTDNHPSVIILLKCHSGDDPVLYHKFSKHPCVRIWTPTTPFTSIPELDSLQLLAGMLRLCDVCVQVASTIRLETAIANKPCISIAYDGDLTPPYSHSVKRFYSFSHQLPLNELHLDHPVYSKSELYQALDNIFSDPTARDYRNKIKKFIHHATAEANITTVNCIREWLK